jgi:hypothetical protein
LANCEEIRPRLAAFLDGEIEDAGPVEEHLSSCPECSRLLEGHRKVSRLVSIVPGPSPDPQAWGSVEPRLSSFWGPRSYALVPAAALALVAVALYLFYYPAGAPRPVGTLARVIGSAQLKTLSTGDWLGAPESEVAHFGDTVRTGEKSSVRMDLVSGGHIFLDGNTEVRFSDEYAPVLRLQLLSGRTCACRCGDFSIEAAGVEMKGSDCHCVIALEDGKPVVYVKSGRLNWIGGSERKAGWVEAMHTLDLIEGATPAPLKSAEAFEWAELLADGVEPGSR